MELSKYFSGEIADPHTTFFVFQGTVNGVNNYCGAVKVLLDDKIMDSLLTSFVFLQMTPSQNRDQLSCMVYEIHLHVYALWWSMLIVHTVVGAQ